MNSPTQLPPPAPPDSSGALYRAVWRWHFYAGLLAAPFAVFLAITGGLYLFKPHYEEWKYKHLFNVPVQGSAISVESQLAAAVAAKPGLRVNQVVPAFEPGRTTEFEFGPARGRGGDASTTRAMSEDSADSQRVSVYVNPYTGVVVGEILDSEREMKTLRKLHGTLLAGRFGETLVEIAASWMFVLLLTGLYLWWPRPRFTVSGFLIPRLNAGGRLFWRDLHAVPAVWLAIGTLFILSSGIPWTKFGGAWLKKVSSAVGEGTPREINARAHRSELTGWSPPLKAGFATKVEQLASVVPGAIDEHAEHRGVAPALGAESKDKSAVPRLSLDRIMEIARERQVPEPYAIAMPVGPKGVTSVLSHYYRATARTYLHLDQYSGKVLADIRYKDVGIFGKFVILGIAIHEGHFFGWPNLALGLLVCSGIILLCVSGVVLWWKRRPSGQLAAPSATVTLPRPLFFGTLGMAFFLPMLAASLAALFVLDLAFFRRLNRL